VGFVKSFEIGGISGRMRRVLTTVYMRRRVETPHLRKFKKIKKIETF
jgi:hypothetical protein